MNAFEVVAESLTSVSSSALNGSVFGNMAAYLTGQVREIIPASRPRSPENLKRLRKELGAHPDLDSSTLASFAQSFGVGDAPPPRRNSDAPLGEDAIAARKRLQSERLKAAWVRRRQEKAEAAEAAKTETATQVVENSSPNYRETTLAQEILDSYKPRAMSAATRARMSASQQKRKQARYAEKVLRLNLPPEALIPKWKPEKTKPNCREPQPVCIQGCIYPSVSKAASALNLNFNVVYNRLRHDDPEYYNWFYIKPENREPS